jgi:RimJ/RimL family protein N-acetyltransferase
MKEINLTKEQIDKSFELLGRIRTDESDVLLECINGETDPYIIKYFNDTDNKGVFLSLLYWGSFRIFIAFEKDTDKYTKDLVDLIHSTIEMNQGGNPTIYFIEEQQLIISGLKKVIKFDENSFYASHEYIMDVSHFEGFVNSQQLYIKPYEEDKIADYLLLLDNSMTFVIPPPRFQENKSSMSEDLRKKVFYSFYRNEKLVGLYWLDNDFRTIDIMAVDCEYQRQGYGHTILSHAINNIFTEQKKDKATLYCVDWNPKGNAFYQKYGMLSKGHMCSMKTTN